MSTPETNPDEQIRDPNWNFDGIGIAPNGYIYLRDPRIPAGSAQLHYTATKLYLIESIETRQRLENENEKLRRMVSGRDPSKELARVMKEIAEMAANADKMRAVAPDTLSRHFAAQSQAYGHAVAMLNAAFSLK